MKGEPIVILLVEDDPAHIEIIRRTFAESRLANCLISVEDGQEALDYMYRKGQYQDAVKFPMPNLILLDLRPTLSSTPVVILTTSPAETDMVKAYENHANSYLVKPVDFTKFNQLMNTFGYYWVVWNQYPHDD
jgi:CheY-like chemotaxis protein